MTKPFDTSTIAHNISDRRRGYEIAGVVATGIGKFIFMNLLQCRLLFITTAIIAWTVYIIYCKNKQPDILKYWGFRMDNFKQVGSMVLPFGIVSVFSFFLIGYFQNTINLTWHILPILIIYPIWGTIQQFLIIALIAGNLKDYQGRTWSYSTIILCTASLFALVHYPNHWLILATFLLSLFYTYIYLRGRNVYILGLFHGWLGGLFFYTVVNRDPFLEVFGHLL